MDASVLFMRRDSSNSDQQLVWEILDFCGNDETIRVTVDELDAELQKRDGNQDALIPTLRKLRAEYGVQGDRFAYLRLWCANMKTLMLVVELCMAGAITNAEVDRIIDESVCPNIKALQERVHQLKTVKATS